MIFTQDILRELSSAILSDNLYINLKTRYLRVSNNNEKKQRSNDMIPFLEDGEKKEWFKWYHEL